MSEIKKISINFLYSIFDNLDTDKFNLNGTIYWKFIVSESETSEQAFMRFKQKVGMSIPAVQKIPGITIDVNFEGELHEGNYIVSNKPVIKNDEVGKLIFKICQPMSYYYFYKL